MYFQHSAKRSHPPKVGWKDTKCEHCWLIYSFTAIVLSKHVLLQHFSYFFFFLGGGMSRPRFCILSS